MFLMKICHQGHNTMTGYMSYTCQGECPSALKNRGAKIVNSSLFSIYVPQDSRIFCMNHNHWMVSHVFPIKDMVVLTTVFWSVSSLGFFALQGKRGHQFSTCETITSK